MKRSAWIVLAIFALGCGKCSSDKGKSGDGTGSNLVDAGFIEADAAAVFAEKITPQILLPIMQTTGSPGVVPNGLSVEFSRNVRDRAPQVATASTILTIEPNVPGALQYTTNSVLQFTPSTPFRPSTTYKVSLESVETRDGVMMPDAPWTMEFTTPEFAFVGLSGGYLDEVNSKAEVDIRFSAAINPDLSSTASWSIDGEKLPSNAVTYSKGYGDHISHAYIRHPLVAQNKTLKLEVEDVPYLLDPKLESEEGVASVTLEAGPPVTLYHASRKEGPNGYYLEVICYDKGAKGGYRYYYSRDSYDSYRVSKRCLPTDESIKQHIKVSPNVEGMRIVSGEGGFNILGDFHRGNYTVRVDAGLRTVDGGVSTKSFEKSVSVPSRTPSIRFTSKGRYLPSKSWKNIPLQFLNTPEAEVTVRYIPKRNVPFWLSSGNENVNSRTSTIVEKKMLKLGGKEDRQATAGIDIGDLVEKPKPGVYEINATGPRGAQDATRVVVTDLNLIVKRAEPKPGHLWGDEAIAWVLDMETNRAEVGVEVNLLRRNGNVFSTCKTGPDGECKLKIPEKDVDPEPPFAVTAQLKDDFTFLKYDELKTSPTTTGLPFHDETKYRTAVYSDRAVYRPGETGHFVAIVRTDEYSAPKEGLPVEVKFFDPRRKFLKSRVLRTNAAGLVSIDQRFPDFAATGSYSFEVKIGKKLLKSHRFSVEEFVPERMKVSAKSSQKDYLMSAPVDVAVDAQYLFGGSAEDSPVELTCRITPTQFTTDKYEDFRFGSEVGDNSPLDLGVVAGTLGTDGKLVMECPKNQTARSISGAAELVATAAVFEAGSGRTSTAIAKTTVHASTYHIGLKTSASRVKVGSTFDVEGVVVDWQGKLKTDVGELEVDFIRLEYDYYWYRDEEDGENSWGKNLRPVVEGTKKVTVKNGKFKVSMSPKTRASKYVVRVKDSQATSDISVRASGWSYYYYDYQSSIDYTPRPQRPTAVPIKTPDALELEKEGEFTFDVPFAGRMLVTIETSNVLKSEWHKVNAGEFKWKYTPKEFVPNVYVTALVVKDPFLDSKETFLPDRAFGVKSVKIKPTTKVHDVTITSPEEIRPNSKLNVEVNVGKGNANSFVTVAAVDEGILSLTRFKTPDPAKQLFAARRLGVETFETVGWTVPRNPAGPSGRTGGGEWDEDGEFGDGLGRVMPIKPVALWSGVVKVGDDGKAKVSFDIPAYRGALRVMVVSADDQKTGSADARVIVRDPLVLQTTLPRFLSAGDEIHVPVFVTNMTGGAKDITLKVEAQSVGIPGVEMKSDGAVVEFLSGQTVKVSVADQASQTAVFKIKALRQAGTAKFKVTAQAEGITSYTEGEVPFRPSGPRETVTTVVELPKGETNLTTSLDGWVPTSETSTIWVTTNPYGRAFDHLKYVIRYPYGCIEQTTSSTRPLLFVGEFVKNADPETLARLGGLDKMVKAGIDRIFSMQTASGGFAYWPGSTTPNSWGTAYATHMLLDAKDRGFEVPDDRLDSVLDYIETVVRNKSGDRVIAHAHDYVHAEAYLHYVLARANRANRAKIQRLINKFPKQSLTGPQREELYLLQAALHLAGDRRYEKALKNVDTSELTNVRETRWSYYSDQRRRAFVLSVFFDLFGNQKSGEKLAKMVANSLSQKASRYYTTQEITWGITGLGKWIQGSAKSMGQPTLKLGDKEIKPNNVTKKSKDSTWVIPRASEYDSVSVNLPSKNGKVYAVISSTGVRIGAEAKTGGEGLSIKREYYDLEGNALEPDAHELGDVVYVKIEVTNNTNRDLHNLALVDRFAGGFEVENPRFGRGTLPSWADPNRLWNVDYMNIRDDRIEAFGSIPRKRTITLTYTVRAVSSGRFLAPPPEIEGMYEPEVWAREKPSIVKVQGPW